MYNPFDILKRLLLIMILFAFLPGKTAVVESWDRFPSDDAIDTWEPLEDSCPICDCSSPYIFN